MLALEPGSEIDGFRLGERMHVGSMASIYRLEGPRGPLPLVMKIPRLGAGERSANVVSFEQCRMVLGALSQSPHHPTLVAYGDVETIPYLVMENIEGTRLDSWIERAPLAPQETARLGHALALALHEVHRQDVIHLDLKATNVIYRASGEAALVDFGLSRHRHLPDLLDAEFHTPVGNWVYMAPEQIAGERRDPRSDLFALGALLYELATGKRAFGAPSTVAQLRRRLYRDPLPPRALVAATPHQAARDAAALGEAARAARGAPHLSRARVGSARSRAARLRNGERGRGDPHGTRQGSGPGCGNGALQCHGSARAAVELTMTE